jgi:hypothetical protein
MLFRCQQPVNFARTAALLASSSPVHHHHHITHSMLACSACLSSQLLLSHFLSRLQGSRAMFPVSCHAASGVICLNVTCAGLRKTLQVWPICSCQHLDYLVCLFFFLCGAGQAFDGVAVGEELPPKLAQTLYDRIVGASCHPQVGLLELLLTARQC